MTDRRYRPTAQPGRLARGAIAAAVFAAVGLGTAAVLDLQQMHRGRAYVRAALDGRDVRTCDADAPCVIRSVPPDICSLLTEGESFLGRPLGIPARFRSDQPCGRGGRYRITVVSPRPR